MIAIAELYIQLCLLSLQELYINFSGKFQPYVQYP